MRSKLEQFMSKPTLAKQVLSSVIVGLLFMGVAYLWKDAYYRYFDTSEYLTIDSPISVGQGYYKPGDIVSVSAGIEAHIDVQAVVLTELVLVETETGNYSPVEGSQIVRDAPFRESDHHLVTTYLQLPKQLKDGQYYWKGNACYQIRGYEKCESYVSQTFWVTQSGLSPAGDGLQHQIDELK
jgi:hypothetical protein